MLSVSASKGKGQSIKEEKFENYSQLLSYCRKRWTGDPITGMRASSLSIALIIDDLQKADLDTERRAVPDDRPRGLADLDQVQRSFVEHLAGLNPTERQVSTYTICSSSTPHGF